MRILVKYPTKHRWHQFKENFQKYIFTCEDLDKVDFLVTVDEDDLWPQDLSRDYGSRNSRKRIGLTVTPPKGKVAAINHNIPQDGWDILVAVADDMIPHQGWDAQIREDIKENPWAWMINYNDDPRLGDHWRDLITLPVMTNECYRHFGWIYNPIYESECCDCEQTEILSNMGKLAYVDKQPIKHEWFKYQTDELTRINSEAGRRDNLIYKERKSRGFKD